MNLQEFLKEYKELDSEFAIISTDPIRLKYKNKDACDKHFCPITAIYYKQTGTFEPTINAYNIGVHGLQLETGLTTLVMDAADCNLNEDNRLLFKELSTL